MIGGNGQGFFQNLDDQTKVWLHECFGDRPFAVNFPGGAESNIATPNPLLKGWGLTEEVINTRFGGGSTDEDGNGLDKWMEKLRQQNMRERSFLYELRDLKQEFPNMEVVWKANIVSGDLQSAKDAFQFVYEQCGSRRLVLGNEVYSKGNFAFDFDAFLLKAQPLIEWVRQYYADVKIGVPYAPSIYREDHEAWNIRVKDDALLFDAIDVHIYQTDDELPEAFNSYPVIKIDYHPMEEYPQLEDCFIHLSAEIDNDKWQDIYEDTPQLAQWCTEFNIKPSSYFCNTVAGAAYLFRTFMTWGEAFEILCVHNLVAPDVYGVISRSDEMDYEQTQNTRRVGYYALRLASEALAHGKPQELVNELTVFQSEVYWFETVIRPELYFHLTAGTGLLIEPPQETFLNGVHDYDSIGRCGYMSKVTEPYDPKMNIEVAYGRVVELASKESVDIEAKSFGYVVVNVKKKLKLFRRFWWQFWREKTSNKLPYESLA